MTQENENLPTSPTRLICLSKGMTGSEFIIKDKEKYIIGRHQDCDLEIDNNAVSGKHCSINKNNGTYSLIDLKSTNGTYVNGTKISSSTVLNDGDIITISGFEVIFKYNGTKNKLKNTMTTTTINLTAMGYTNQTVTEMKNFSPYQHRVSKKAVKLINVGITVLIIVTAILLWVICQIMMW